MCNRCSNCLKIVILPAILATIVNVVAFLLVIINTVIVLDTWQ